VNSAQQVDVCSAERDLWRRRRRRRRRCVQYLACDERLGLWLAAVHLARDEVSTSEDGSGVHVFFIENFVHVLEADNFLFLLRLAQDFRHGCPDDGHAARAIQFAAGTDPYLEVTKIVAACPQRPATQRREWVVDRKPKRQRAAARCQKCRDAPSFRHRWFKEKM